jgi:hypothetical protein
VTDKTRDPARAAIVSHLKDEIVRAGEIQQGVWATASFLEKTWPGIFEEVAAIDAELRELTDTAEYRTASAALAKVGAALPEAPREVLDFKPKGRKP